MNKCQNPECNKEISNDKHYCNEQCLKRHLEIKKMNKNIPNSTVNIPDDTVYEIKEIMDCLGRSHSEGFIKGTHLSTILSYLRQKKTETFRLTKAKLALICGMGQRYLSENYLDGIEAFGIIEMGTNEYNERFWKWKGLKALRDNFS